MRIIAGDYKGRKLESPGDRNMDIRPTTDKVKEAIFSILMPYTEDGIFVDLFSGTGSLGLEALSRGASLCYFCDKEKSAISIIKANIEKCGAEEYSKVIHGDYMKLIHRLEGSQADVFLIDPPYTKTYESSLYDKALNSIDSLDLLKDDGIIVAEHPKDLKLPENIGNLTIVRERSYGKVVLSMYKKANADNNKEMDREE